MHLSDYRNRIYGHTNGQTDFLAIACIFKALISCKSVEKNPFAIQLKNSLSSLEKRKN